MNEKVVKLKDICTIKSGYAFKKGDFTRSGVPVVKIANLNGEEVRINEKTSFVDQSFFTKLSEYRIKKGDILIALSGATTGKLAINYLERDLLLNQRVGIIKPKNDKVESKFMYYILKHVQGRILSDAFGVAQPNISPSKLLEYEVPVPCIKLQRKIIEILECMNNVIKKRENQIKVLSNLKQSVFYDMFGDPQLNTKNWKKGRIRDLTESTQYGSSKKASETKGQYPILRMNNITYDGELVLSDLKYIDLDEKEKTKHLVSAGDLLFNRTNSKELVGKTTVYDKNDPVAYAGYLVKLIPNDLANSNFISGYLNSNYGKRYLYNMAKNIVGMANINAKELQSIPIIIPPKELQDKYEFKLKEINTRLEIMKNSIQEYQNLYNSLMQKAFKGKLLYN
ncbi:restriction endonuclease subunit S [Halobacillus andaensis]|uniref:restriction endonuclease subunit S n=1 Tax=Halobacillus andaensis TaxID=1176239 RepID=UPI003D71F597